MVHGFAKTKPALSLRHFVLQWENILTGTTSSLAWSLQDTTTQPHTLLASWIWTMLSCSIKIYLVLVYFNPIESRFLISLSYIITLLFNIFSYNWKLNKPCSKIILCTQQWTGKCNLWKKNSESWCCIVTFDQRYIYEIKFYKDVV